MEIQTALFFTMALAYTSLTPRAAITASQRVENKFVAQTLASKFAELLKSGGADRKLFQ